MPNNCVLNSLYYDEIPDAILRLNQFEKMLIQRAKAFQVVSSIIPVGNKNIPNNQAIKKVKDRTFHLPLPLESTLKMLPNPEEPINKNQELYILVRSSSTKNKIIWQDLVDVSKVFRALAYMKQHNPHYADIILPGNPAELLNGLDETIQYEVEDQRSDEDVLFQSIAGRIEECGDAMITQVSDEIENSWYEQYTIYPLNEEANWFRLCFVPNVKN